jgi:hypothetical protein
MPVKSKRGRPTNIERMMKYKVGLSYLHFKYLIPKKFRTPEVFGIILKNELRGTQCQ